MSTTAGNRILGLSPRARRLVIPAFVIAIAVISIGTYVNRKNDGAKATGPVVGGDLHAVAQLDDRLFVGGHAGAGYRVASGGWTQIQSLADKDVMSWAQSGSTLLAGGHEGLYASADDGSMFTPVPGLSISDVHGLGAAGDTVYLASPQAGILVSTDGGDTFATRSQTGQDFMGSIWVDPTNPEVAIAPSMQQGAVKTTDGGRNWTALGSSMGAMAVAVNPTGTQLVALAMDGAQQSADGGRTWARLSVPDGTSAASYTSTGDLIVAARSGDRASVYRQTATGWDPLV